ncbi:MAG: 4-hydroxy-tetrahydrodipicolinate reductase [Holosporales bacterium]|nr:4-hydroxy-tetrahydrodipicolinate reductase [Holosporales bacterium]
MAEAFWFQGGQAVKAIRLSILGATGKMGQLVAKCAGKDRRFEVGNRISSRDAICDLFSNTDAVVDFSTPEATELMLEYGASMGELRTPLVVGTTGLSERHHELMLECSKKAAVFCSPNMSFLVAVLNKALASIVKALAEDFDAEILDIHHKLKKDAPSGTAIMFGKTIAAARNQEFGEVANFLGYTCRERRKHGSIGFASQRCGTAIGTHEVTFAGQNESLKLRHEAYSKDIFAAGALQVTLWLVRQPNGFYTMDDYGQDLLAAGVY